MAENNHNMLTVQYKSWWVTADDGGKIIVHRATWSYIEWLWGIEIDAKYEKKGIPRKKM